MQADTIAAIATAPGRGALAIVRVSGPEALAIVGSRFRGTLLEGQPSHTAHVGWLEDGDGEPVDQVVVTLFRAPRSATGEDVVEVSCHGGAVVPQRVLRALLDAGASPAEPGAFTKRAFLSGKIDLTQAEAVADLIHAESALAHRVSTAHLRGRYAARLEESRQEIIQACSLVELELDFTEEDVAFIDRTAFAALLNRLISFLDNLLGSYELGSIVRDGALVVLGGRPNAGKSTLLNALVGHARAIVSDTPGTTRDSIEAEAEIGGLRFRFVDTAGLRDTADVIEAEGVRRAEDATRGADALVYVFDATLGLDTGERDWLAALQRDRPELPVVLLANKSDLGGAVPRGALAFSAHAAGRDEAALAPLHHRLLGVLGAEVQRADEGLIVVSARHRRHLAEARTAAVRASAGLEEGVSGDLLAFELREALHHLGAITGVVTSDDVLGAIFSRFCIGK